MRNASIESGYSAFMCAAPTTLPHFSVSSAMSVPELGGRARQHDAAEPDLACSDVRPGRSFSRDTPNPRRLALDPKRSFADAAPADQNDYRLSEPFDLNKSCAVVDER
jgi:hypothetical protein